MCILMTTIVFTQAKAAAARRGETLRAFDTNAISPGSQFMNDVTSNLKFYVRRKISENGAWQVPKVIISGKLGVVASFVHA